MGVWNLKEMFLWVAERSVTACWIIAAVLLLRLLLSKAPKRIRGVLWVLVALRLVCPVFVESAWSLLPRGNAGTGVTFLPDGVLQAVGLGHAGGVNGAGGTSGGTVGAGGTSGGAGTIGGMNGAGAGGSDGTGTVGGTYGAVGGTGDSSGTAGGMGKSWKFLLSGAVYGTSRW